MSEYPNIEILDYPIEVNMGEWTFGHPDCNSIIQQIGTGPKAMVYAYAKSKDGNSELKTYRDECMDGQEILVGLTKDAISSLS